MDNLSGYRPSNRTLLSQVTLAYMYGKTPDQIREWLQTNLTVNDRAFLRLAGESVSDATNVAFGGWMSDYGNKTATHESSSARRQVATELRIALKILPDTAVGIYRTLEYAGIRGVKRDACHCAISNYIRRAIGAACVSTGGGTVLADGARAELPSHVAEFITAFDDGEFDGIADENARGLFWLNESV